jgi:glc operon protein GlcG
LLRQISAKQPSSIQLSDINSDLATPEKWPASSANEKPQKFMKIAPGAIVTALIVMALGSHAQVIEKKSLNLEGAKMAIAAAVDYAKKNNAPGGVVAVVDEGGNLMALERLDGSFAMGATISIGKARTAVLFKKPTRFFEELINKGRTAMTAVDGFTPLIGGIPIIVDGQVVGGIGVSGAASANQDEELALAGAAAVAGRAEAGKRENTEPGSTPPATTATFIDAQRVTAAFAKGQPLLETGGYKVHASRRVEPGQAEIHTLDTDVIYVVDGSATLVTGGKAIDAKEIAPNEIRGTKIEGGQEHQISKGEVIVIPNGVPHQFTAVTGELHYFVCKPTANTPH